MIAAERLDGDLGWIARTLWADGGPVRATTDPDPAAGSHRLASLAIVPNRRNPRLLVSTSRGAGRAGLFQFNASMTRGAKLRKAAAGWAFEIGVGPMIARDRLHLDVADDAADADLPDVSIQHHLAAVLGLDRIGVCVSFGVVRPNRKPVVQAIGPDGRVVGYAKIAWNDLTDALVAAEGDALDGLTASPPRAFDCPRVVHRGRWRGRQLLVTSALDGSIRAVDASAVGPAMREIAERDGIARMAVADAPLVGEAAERVAGLPPDRAAVVAEVLDAYGRRFGDTDVTVGSWHGDWAPWNMNRVGGRLGVYDWERARRGVPVGLDAIHHAFQVALRANGRRVAQAGARAEADAAAPLAVLGVPPSAWPPLFGAYLIELLLRYEDAIGQGVVGPQDPMRGDLTSLLGSLVGVRTP